LGRGIPDRWRRCFRAPYATSRTFLTECRKMPVSPSAYTALVTGASGGIGRAIAEQFARAGTNLVSPPAAWRRCMRSPPIGRRATASPSRSFLGLVENEGDLLLAEPRLLHRQIPSVAKRPNLPEFSHSDRSSFPGSGQKPIGDCPQTACRDLRASKMTGFVQASRRCDVGPDGD
jgi:hypothetical protein